MKDAQTVTFKVWRGAPGNQYWESFVLPRMPSMNVISGLMQIQREPINDQGERVTPVVWEQGCLEEVCGSCSMLINGMPRQACTALVAPILRESGSDTIILAPFTKYPLVRDLIVDRSRMFENLKKVHAWIEIDTTFDRGFGPQISQKLQTLRYNLSTCMTCGCCSESCPQTNDHSDFIGPYAIAQAHLFNTHPTGALQAEERNHALMQRGGIADCGNAQNCQKVCPKKLELTRAIGAVGRAVTKQSFTDLFGWGATEATQGPQ